MAWVVPGGFEPEGREVIPALVSLLTRTARRHALRVVQLRPDREAGEFDFHGARVIDLGPRPADLGRRLSRVLASIAPFRPQIVHGFWASQSGLLAGLAARALGVPAVLSIGGGELVWLPDIGYGGSGSRRGRARLMGALSFARAITAGSKHVLAELPARAMWLPLGAERACFERSVERSSGARLLHIASVNQVKDPRRMLDVLEAVRAHRADVTLDWIGVDTLGGEIAREASLRALPIRFHGQCAPSVVADLAARAHVHVQTSRYESQGVAVLEAALAGCALVGTPVGLLREMAPHAARTAMDATQLAGEILTLLDDPRARAALARAGRAYARHHDADWTARQFNALYEDLT